MYSAEQGRIEHWNVERDGECSQQSMQRKLERRGYRVSHHTLPPATVVPLHAHGADRVDAVVTGVLRMTLDGQEIVLGAGDAVLVPRGVWHTAEVVGNEAVIGVDAIRL